MNNPMAAYIALSLPIGLMKKIDKPCKVLMKRVILILILIASLCGCSTKRPPTIEVKGTRADNYQNVVAALDKAEALWATAQIESYCYHIRRFGVFGGSLYKAIYRNDSCHAYHLKDIGASSDFSCGENSMPQLFAEIRRIMASKDSDISVSFDQKLGYVNWLSVEPNPEYVPDQGWGVEISHFKALKKERAIPRGQKSMGTHLAMPHSK